MAKPELLQSITILSKKIDILLQQQKSLQERIDNLEMQNQELRKQHDVDVSLLDNAKKNIEFLSVSHRLAATPEAIISARKKISSLIRTIDSCIRMINED